MDRILKLFQGGLREWYIQILIDLRRGIDLLTSQPDLDLNRLGYVDHSFGALFGGVLTCVEDRIKSYVLMAGTGSFSDVAVANIPDLPENMLENHKKMMDPIDPIHYVAHAFPSTLFFQFGLNDTLFPKQNQMEYYNAASKPKQIKWYDAGHYLSDEARKDRVEWLISQLNLKQG